VPLKDLTREKLGLKEAEEHVQLRRIWSKLVSGD